LVGEASYTDADLTNGTEYFYRVTAVDTSGNESIGSNQASATPTDQAPPAAPTGLQATAGDRQVDLGWDANPEEDLAGYDVYRSTSSFQEVANATQVNDELVGEASYTDADLTNGTEYFYRVTAVDDAGNESTGSNEASATPEGAPVAQTESATDVTSTGALLNGAVNPNGLQTTVEFEYYPTGQQSDAQTVTAQESPVMGDEEQSVSASVGGLQPATEYEFRLRAENGGGDSAGSVRTFTTDSLEITIGQSAEAPEQGNALDVTVSVPEGFVPTEQELFYRQVGTQSFQSTALETTGELTYEGTIPGSAVTERGLQYYARLSNGIITTTVPEGGAEAPRYVPVQTSQTAAGVTLNPSQYQMISVPLRLDTTNALAQLRDDFGEIDRTEWRLLRWSPQAEEYEEVTTSENASGSGGGTLVPGQAYWLITRSGQTQEGDQAFDVGPGRSVPAVPIPIELPPGCSQIANPRPYPVAWSSVGERESVMDPVAYTPSATDSLDFGVEVLDPWAGYWVCNPGESAAQISVPPQEADVGASQMAEKSEASGENALFDEESMFDVRPTYALRLAGRLERAGAPDLRDAQNVVGVADAGRPGGRAEDVAEPPPIGSEYLRLSVVEETLNGRSMQLAGSLRPPSSKGQTWDVKVSASGAEEEPHTVRGRLQARGALPQGFERRLLDRDTGRPIPIEEDGTFTLQLTDERSTRHLRLIVGAEGFTETESESIRPERTGLRAVYPNPSRGPVSVDYHLKKTQRVEVRVFDLLGRTVKTLVSGQREAGHYTARWSATDVASGMYLVRLQTESTSATQRVSVVH
jgi:fibronectin type 3 domain-containing protein